MDDIINLKNSYITLKNKCLFVKNYISHVEAISKKSSDLLFRATHIPRDNSWNDTNINTIIEIADKQRNLYDEISGLLSHTIYTDIDAVISQINQEISQIDKDLGIFNKDLQSKYAELDILKNNHIMAYKKGSDVWLSDVRLKACIKNICKIKENSGKILGNKIEDNCLTYSNIQQIYIQIINTYIKIQKSLYNNMIDTLNIRITDSTEYERFFDTSDENSQDKLANNIENSYEGVLESIKNDLSNTNITVSKNIEPSKYCICKFKKGIAGDWFLALCVITSNAHLYLIDIYEFLKKNTKYSRIVDKVMQNNSKYFVSIFDSSKNKLSFSEEKEIIQLGEEIMMNIDLVCNNIILSFDGKAKKIKMNKDRFILNVEDKIQNGFSSLFGISIIKIKTFTLTSCFELFFALTKQNDFKEEIVKNIQNGEEQSSEDIYQNQEKEPVVFTINEENPWIQ